MVFVFVSLVVNASLMPCLQVKGAFGANISLFTRGINTILTTHKITSYLSTFSLFSII